MTISSLDAALSGLKAAQRALDVTSNNIANASTPGFTRKILPQQTQVIAGEGVGVRLSAIARSVDKALLADIARQISFKGKATVRENYLERIQGFHGASEAERSISAAVSRLRNSFTELSSTPDSVALQEQVVTQARQTAARFNDFADMITRMRNQTQDEMKESIIIVNNALQVIAETNIQISSQSQRGESIAALEDQRDIALRTVSEYLEISTFANENGKITVQTRQGHLLADDRARKLLFNPLNLVATSTYPGGGAEGVYIEGLPTPIDITATNLGGKIGGLLELRDQTLVQYQAQIDELAHKMAQRFNSQGLRLFSDAAGSIPPGSSPPAPVSYTGFASVMQVNPQVLADVSLVQRGTVGESILPGSSEVIKRVLDFTFGSEAFIRALGNVDISTGPLMGQLSLTPLARVAGSTSITALTPDLVSHPDIAPGAQFNLTISPGTTTAITLNPGDTAIDLVNQINTLVGSGTAELNGLGQLVLSGGGNITISDISLGADGLAALGHSFGVTNAQTPSFVVQVGSQAPVTLTLQPTDTAADLLTALNTISGLTASLNGSGQLVMRPTNGGGLTVTDGAGAPLAAMGIRLEGVRHPEFRRDNLGAAGDLSTGLLGVGTLEEFGRAMIVKQSEDYSQSRGTLEREDSFLTTLETRNSDMTGVDIDQELSELIRIQTAYTAAARMIAASNKLLDDLFAAFN